jgi:hypothetical protein
MKTVAAIIRSRIVWLMAIGLFPVAAVAQGHCEIRDHQGTPTAGAAVARHDPPSASAIRAALARLPQPHAGWDHHLWTARRPVHAQASTARRGSAIRWGVVLGIGTGVAVSAAAASRYGENEGGEFCTRCFVQWSAISVPVGAGIGAAVGYLVDRARR